MHGLWRLAAGAVLSAALASPCTAQSADPLPRFAVDVHGAWAGLPSTPGWVPPVSANTPIPSRGWGASAGAHVYRFHLGFATFGAGASLLVAQAQGRSITATTTAHGKTTTAAVPTAIVTTRVTNLSPQLSINFGHRLGWSYISAGYGVTRIDSTAAAVGTTPELRAPDTWDPAINFGGGARWFMKDHLGAGFDVRWNKLSSRATTATAPGAKRTQLFTMAVGITLR